MKTLIRRLIKTSMLCILVFQLSIPIAIYPRSDDIIEQINILLDQTNARGYANVPIVKSSGRISKKEKEWTLILYISADNDLRNFAIRNIKQMAKIGSNQNINIVVHLDIKLSGNKKSILNIILEGFSNSLPSRIKPSFSIILRALNTVAEFIRYRVEKSCRSNSNFCSLPLPIGICK